MFLGSPVIKQMIAENAKLVDLRRQARKEGMISLFLSGIDKVHRGITTYEEVLRATTGTVLMD